VVVGPSGEEIYTDEYGRVKVQFFWDRLGKKDEHSSCWIRVSQLFAGKTWGAMFLPRIGQEVLVDFMEGDPDQPVITGRVYNADQTPPGTLPDKMNVSGWRTRSTKGGGEHDANVLAFDDTKGSEVFYMRAEKDMAIRVQNNEDTHVMNNQTITVDNDRTEVVTKGNETVEIKQGNRSHKITTGNETLDVAQGNRSVKVDMGNDSLEISLGNQTTKLDLGAASTDAMQSITLTVGQSSITINQMGVTIKGMMITIEGQVQTQVTGMMTQISGSAMLQCQGAITMIN
jgi:type VI secretion system secreted protein VgrG